MSEGDPNRISPRQLREAYAAGRMPRSRWLTLAAVWAALALGLRIWGPDYASSCLRELQQFTVAVTSQGVAAGDAATLTGQLTKAGWLTLRLLLAPACLGIAVVILAGGWQTGYRLFASSLGQFPQPAALWTTALPLQLARVALTGVHLLVTTAAVSWLGWHLAASGLHTGTWSPYGMWFISSRWLAAVAAVMSASCLVFGTLEYLLARWHLHQSLAMSDDELRRELRAIDGDPRIESQRRQRHQELSYRR